MKQRRVWLFLLALISAHANADDKLGQAKQTLKAKLAAIQTFTAEFEQTVTDVEGNVLQEATGQLTLKQPNKLYWEVDEPNENTLIADGITLWHLDPFVEQVVATSQQDAIENNPVVLLTSPDSEAWSQFQVVEDSENTFMVMAMSDVSHIAALSISFEGETFSALRFIDRQQQVSHLTFSEAQQNYPLDDETFVFQLPEGFDLDDQRN